MRQRFGDAKNGAIMFEDLQKNDILSAIFARVKYFESKEPIPSMSDIDAQAEYYKRIYNTAKGKANVERFKKLKSDFLKESK